ncbi:MAG: hypothetical protein H7833_11580 [Magnetococcus sp. DMHC-1]
MFRKDWSNNLQQTQWIHGMFLQSFDHRDRFDDALDIPNGQILVADLTRGSFFLHFLNLLQQGRQAFLIGTCLEKQNGSRQQTNSGHACRQPTHLLPKLHRMKNSDIQWACIMVRKMPSNDVMPEQPVHFSGLQGVFQSHAVGQNSHIHRMQMMVAHLPGTGIQQCDQGLITQNINMHFRAPGEQPLTGEVSHHARHLTMEKRHQLFRLQGRNRTQTTDLDLTIPHEGLTQSPGIDTRQQDIFMFRIDDRVEYPRSQKRQGPDACQRNPLFQQNVHPGKQGCLGVGQAGKEDVVLGLDLGIPAEILHMAKGGVPQKPLRPMLQHLGTIERVKPGNPFLFNLFFRQIGENICRESSRKGVQIFQKTALVLTAMGEPGRLAKGIFLPGVGDQVVVGHIKKKISGHGTIGVLDFTFGQQGDFWP